MLFFIEDVPTAKTIVEQRTDHGYACHSFCTAMLLGDQNWARRDRILLLIVSV